MQPARDPEEPAARDRRNGTIILWALSAFGAVVVASLLVLGARASEPLRALRDDPFARYEPPGGRLVDTSEDDQGRYWWGMGNAHGSAYRRLFELPPGDREQQFQHALDAAVAAGWWAGPLAEGPLDERPFDRFLGDFVRSGEKQLRTGRAGMAVTLFVNGAPSREATGPAMLIKLEHPYAP